MHNFLITIDVEDWFQVENLRRWNPVSTWDQRELRVERNVHVLLELFDAFEFKVESSTPGGKPSDAIAPAASSHEPRVKKVKCTFFILGWVAQRLPHLIREIADCGHEVASHGYSHQMCNRITNQELRSDLLGSKRLLEDITGKRVAGFRAPNFSVDDRVLGTIRECGYRYDSSYNSFALHGRYGKISLNGGRAGVAHIISDNFFELPISNLPIFRFPIFGRLGVLDHFRHFEFPWGGGAYFRILPFPVFKRGVLSILKAESAYVFYMHPWEIDPDQPRAGRVFPLNHRLRHYTHLKMTEEKLRKMIGAFADCRFVSCGEYLAIQGLS